MKIILLFFVLLTSLAYGHDVSLACSPWGTENGFELYAELEESGSTYLDAFIDFKLYKNGVIIHQKNSVDTTGFYNLATVNRTVVYVAELRAMNRTDFDFLSVAANHPVQSGNSVLTYQGQDFLAECRASY